MNFETWAELIYAQGKSKGWHTGDHVGSDDPDFREAMAVHLTNLHSEISELWEAYREGRVFMDCDKASKMREQGLQGLTCIQEELADIVIRALDMAATFRVDIQTAVEAKHAYNASRPHRHGGKLA